MYTHDNRIVATLDAGGTNLVFGAMQACEYIIDPITLPSNAHDLNLCLATIVDGFTQVMERLETKPVAISFAFPGPADYPAGIIGGFLPNFPSFRDGVPLGPFLEEHFGLPVFINNDGDLYAFGEAAGGILPEINRRVAASGSDKVYRNLVGFTFGTGLGIGEVIDGRLNTGNNSCVEAFCLRHRDRPEVIAEDGASIRAITREYAAAAETDATGLTPYDIYLIAEGKKEGDRSAAVRAFEMFGTVAGDVFATAATLLDAVIVVGGGLTGAMKYIRPALLREMRSTLATLKGETVARVQPQVFDLDSDDEFALFCQGDPVEIAIPGTERTVTWQRAKQTGVATSRIGASKAISIGAYSFALAGLDAPQ